MAVEVSVLVSDGISAASVLATLGLAGLRFALGLGTAAVSELATLAVGSLLGATADVSTAGLLVTAASLATAGAGALVSGVGVSVVVSAFAWSNISLGTSCR